MQVALGQVHRLLWSVFHWTNVGGMVHYGYGIYLKEHVDDT